VVVVFSDGALYCCYGFFAVVCRSDDVALCLQLSTEDFLVDL